MNEADALLEYALNLRIHGEKAIGGNRTWNEFDRRAELYLRRTTETTAVDIHDHIEPPTGQECAHCGKPQRGEAAIDGRPVCHTSGAYPDCYRLVSVYGEPLGSRHTAIDGRRVRRLLDNWSRQLQEVGVETGFDAEESLEPPHESDEESITARSTVDRVRALLEEWERLGRGGGTHGRQLRAALDPPEAGEQGGEEGEELSFPAEWRPAMPRLEGGER